MYSLDPLAYSLLSSLYLLKYGEKSDPITNCKGCISMIGAQYDAIFALPSNIVFINGSPKASVLCDALKVAATASPGVLFNNFDLKNENSVINVPICSNGSIINKTIA